MTDFNKFIEIGKQHHIAQEASDGCSSSTIVVHPVINQKVDTVQRKSAPILDCFTVVFEKMSKKKYDSPEKERKSLYLMLSNELNKNGIEVRR